MNHAKEAFAVPLGGLGNQIESLGVYLDLCEHRGKTDLIIPNSIAEDFWRIITKWKHAKLFYASDIKSYTYDRVYVVRMGQEEIHKNAYYVPGTKTRSEVDDNRELLRKLGIVPTPTSLPWAELRPSVKDAERFDFLICNGGAKGALWMRKRYQRWNEVVQRLRDKGYKAGSIGLPYDYIYPAENRTGIGMLKTMDLICKCNVGLYNDTGLYHFACAIDCNRGRDTLVVFTATNPAKNFDKIFHRRAIGIKPKIECFPCQGVENSVWNLSDKWLKCKDWKCTRLQPDLITQIAIDLHGKTLAKNRITKTKSRKSGETGKKIE